MERRNTLCIRIRPEERDGRMQIKGDVKEKKEGDRFRTVAHWDIPPADKGLWDRDITIPH